MIKVIKNIMTVTMNKNDDIKIYDIVIENDQIIEICNNYEGNYDEIIDGTNKVVIPGLINCHTHGGMSLFRNTFDGEDLMSWLNNKIWPREDKLTGEDLYYGMLLSCVEMIKTGTTCFADMYFEPFDTIKAIEKTKMRSLFSNCLIETDDKAYKRIEILEELYNKYNGKNNNITFSVNPHSLYTCGEKYLVDAKQIADKYNIPIHLHFCENEDEVTQISNKFGMSPIKALEKLGYLDNKLILAHAVHLDKKDYNLLKNKDISLVHNPVSNLALGCGIAPVSDYLANGFNVCLGTDGQGSGNNLNLFNAMQIALLLQENMHGKIKSYDILKMATINGAKALGLEDKIGSIEISKKADLVILNLNNIEIYPENNLISQIVQNVELNNIETTIINGEVLMKDRKLLLDIDEKELKQKINVIIEKIK